MKKGNTYLETYANIFNKMKAMYKGKGLTEDKANRAANIFTIKNIIAIHNS